MVSLLSFNFAEVWRYRDLLYLLTRRDIVAFYKQTILGPLWFFIQPIFTALTYVLVFGQIAQLSTDVSLRSRSICAESPYGITSLNVSTKRPPSFAITPICLAKLFPRVISPLSDCTVEPGTI